MNDTGPSQIKVEQKMNELEPGDLVKILSFLNKAIDEKIFLSNEYPIVKKLSDKLDKLINLIHQLSRLAKEGKTIPNITQSEENTITLTDLMVIKRFFEKGFRIKFFHPAEHGVAKFLLTKFTTIITQEVVKMQEKWNKEKEEKLEREKMERVKM